MVQIIWHSNALDNLHHISNYIAQNSPYYAKLTVEKIKNATLNLKKFPKMGRKLPELNYDSIRELIIQNYRVIYWIQQTDINIIAVLHSKQNLDPSRFMNFI